MSAVMEVVTVADVHAGREPARVTLRETRERVFRALRTAGAGGSQARTVTEQVIFAELHRGSGLAELLAALPAVSWEPAEPVRSHSSGGGVVEQVETAGLLPHATALVDLVAAEPRLPVVVRAGLTASSALLDEPLSRSARITGRYLSAWEHTAQGGRVRVAAPDGSLATGVMGTDAVGRGSASAGPAATGVPATGVPDAGSAETGSTDAGQGATLPAGALPLGAVVLRSHEASPRGELSWLDAEQQRARRLHVIVEGLLVDAAVWQRLGAIAQHFLVPDA